jgi:hypothetical protein
MTRSTRQDAKHARDNTAGRAFALPSRSDPAAALPVALIVAGLLAGTVLARRRGHGIGGETVVRCSRQHLFTTIWIPGASFKAPRLGPLRFQRCPVGQHWSLVAPVRAADLTEEQRQAAAAFRDTRIP